MNYRAVGLDSATSLFCARLISFGNTAPRYLICSFLSKCTSSVKETVGVNADTREESTSVTVVF